jgi:hypothetical protein
VFAGFPQVHWSTQRESQRQSGYRSPTKINKDVISKQVQNGRESQPGLMRVGKGHRYRLWADRRGYGCSARW